jgi:HD-GYP domain-containing protein (c-di-GMP phosphodiesterase class II)
VRAVSVDKVKPGMEVGRNIYSAKGNILLSKGITLTEKYIGRLKDFGIMSLYVASKNCSEIEVNDFVSERTRSEALTITKQTLKIFHTTSMLNISKINDVIEKIIAEVTNNRDLLANFMDIRSLNDYTFAHSVNVAVLSLVTGLNLGLPQKKLKPLALGAIFHDLGKVAVKKLIKNDESETNVEIMKRHPEYGFEILRKAEGVGLQAAHIAFQHHENYDGSGYPRGLSGEDISLLARIVGVVSAFDNLTSDTSNRPRFMPQYAVEYLSVNMGGYYDPEVVRSFVSNVALFPVGIHVLLNSGEIGVVIKTHRQFPTRPVVKIIIDYNGKELNPPFDIDLMDNHIYFLERVLEEEEI